MDLIKAKELCLQLMLKHGLTEEKGWKFEWLRSKKVAGKCITVGSCKIVGYTSTGRKIKVSTGVTNGGTILLSSFITSIHTEEEVLDTILHEIAHGLTPGNGHDDVWIRKAIEIGCSGKRCYSVSEELAEIRYPIVAICCKCGRKHYKSRIPKEDHWCKCLGKTFRQEEKLKWVSNEKPQEKMSNRRRMPL
jgi:hypothetical protein